MGFDLFKTRADEVFRRDISCGCEEVCVWSEVGDLTEVMGCYFAPLVWYK